MAVTIRKKIEMGDNGKLWPFPVASGETILGGTLAAVCADGLLYNMDSDAALAARMIVMVADDSANTTPAATTGAGSISGTFEEASAVAGDKTVRLCYIDGQFELTFTAIAQSDVGKTVYATDNYTIDEGQALGVKVGTLVTYISATKGWVDLNRFYQADGAIVYKGNMIAVTGTGAGGALALSVAALAAGEPIIIEELYVDITTGSTGAATIDIGVAANGTTSADTIIDGAVCSVATLRSISKSKGTNGGPAKAAANQYITGTASATLAGLVATYTLKYRITE